MCFLFLKMILRILSGGPTTTLNEICKYFLLYLPLCGRREKEADYIGLLLLASAGYDPRCAPQVYEKFDELEELGELGSSLLGYLTTHPSGKTREQLLSQDKVMKEAISIYKESCSRRDTKRRVWFLCGLWFFTLLCIILLCC
ncbi:hypothetical protein MKX03_003615 [Papaver bracteatum]|nr:hypothetical protein MKX03_003615 [Papaver bracteatum]